jgi:pyridinium-3,5-bisthiocarboxylic acid mononucleotide nickel chelatase
MKSLYFDCFSGVSGDMILGALVDSGVDLETIQSELGKLKLTGYSLKAYKTKRGQISGTKVDVELAETKNDSTHHGRHLSEIKKIIEESNLSEEVKKRSLNVFQKIGVAEAGIHNIPLEKVHFHEVGALDSIVDIVGSIAGIVSLNADKIYASAINTGEGMVKCDHGTMPVPAPATVKLLKDIPCYSSGVKKELATPTGVAILSEIVDEFGSLPPMKIQGSGFGAGGHEIESTPNLLRLIVGEMEEVTGSVKNMIMVETNIDDMNPEFYDHISQRLFDAGAVDVFSSPILMKKNRPAQKLSILAPSTDFQKIKKIVFEESTTFGLRYYSVDRAILDRKNVVVETVYGSVNVKIGSLNGEVLQIAPEYEDCKALSKEKQVPLKQIYNETLQKVQGYTKQLKVD